MTEETPLIEELCSLEEFGRAATGWAELQERCGVHSIFSSHSWLMACARHLGPGERLLILLIREKGKLVGAAPLVHRPTRVRRLPATEIGFLGNPLTPSCDFLFECPQTGVEVLIDHLLHKHNDWDLLSLAKLREDSPTIATLRERINRSKNIFTTDITSRTPYLEISGTWEDFWRRKSQKFRKTRRSVANRVERLGPVSVELIEDEQRASMALQEFLYLSQRSWTRQQGTDLLTPEFESGFLRELTRIAIQHGWLRIWLLRLQDKVIAGEFHLNDGKVEYGLRAHYDAAYASSSPGSYLDTQIVERLFLGGCSLYDMGPGVVSYKTAWTEKVYECRTAKLFHRRLYSRLLGRLEGRWIPAVRNSRLGKWLTGPKIGDDRTQETEPEREDPGRGK